MAHAQCYVEVLPNPALLASLFGEDCSAIRRPFEGRCWLSVSQMLGGENCEWRFLLEAWCLYRRLETKPYISAARAPAGIEIALTPVLIIEFIDWACVAITSRQPASAPVAIAPLLRLRAFLADDLKPESELRVIAH